MEVPWRGDALSRPSAMALLTMALLTTARLTMARLTILHLLWATTVPAQLVCLLEVAEPEVVADPRHTSIDLIELRTIGARAASASLLVRAGLGSGSGFGSGSGSGLGLGLGLGSGSGSGSGLGQCPSE